MIQQRKRFALGYRRSIVFIVIALLLSSVYVITSSRPAGAAACVMPGTDFGTATQTVNISEAGTYRIWTRMAAPNGASNTYLLEIDNAECYEVGGTSVPVYANQAGPYFVTGTTNWTARTATSMFIDVPLTSGNHTIEMIGAHDGVVVDRILFTQDTACVPTGVGANCATEFFAADINEDSVVNFLDFSLLASSYGQSTAGRSDINRDATVNFLDFSLLANKYGS